MSIVTRWQLLCFISFYCLTFLKCKYQSEDLQRTIIEIQCWILSMRDQFFTLKFLTNWRIYITLEATADRSSMVKIDTRTEAKDWRHLPCEEATNAVHIFFKSFLAPCCRLFRLVSALLNSLESIVLFSKFHSSQGFSYGPWEQEITHLAFFFHQFIFALKNWNIIRRKDFIKPQNVNFTGNPFFTRICWEMIHKSVCTDYSSAETIAVE